MIAYIRRLFTSTPAPRDVDNIVAPLISMLEELEIYSAQKYTEANDLNAERIAATEEATRAAMVAASLRGIIY